MESKILIVSKAIVVMLELSKLKTCNHPYAVNIFHYF